MPDNRYHILIWLELALMVGAASAAQAPDPARSFFRSNRGVEIDSGPLPERFDAPGALRWRVELDPGHSTPIFCGDRIFLTTYREGAKELAAVALDKRTGRTLWRQPVVVRQVEQTHTLGSPATATAACDGRRVYVFYGSYGLLGYDL